MARLRALVVKKWCRGIYIPLLALVYVNWWGCARPQNTLGAAKLRIKIRRRCRCRIELPRQGLDREHPRIRKERQCILIDRIDRRIGKDDVSYLRKLLVAQSFYVIACNDAHGTQIRQAKRLHQIVTEPLCGNIEESLTFLYKDSFDSHRKPPS